MQSSDEKPRVVFLDRDGTIIVDKHYLHRVEDVEFVPDAVEALRILADCGFALVVVSDQSGVALGMFTEDDVLAVHAHLNAVLAREGVRVQGWFYCPHHPRGTVPAYAVACACRKPLTGLADQAQAVLGPIDSKRSWVIGDKPSDVAFGQSLGAKTALLHSEYWTELPTQPPDLAVNSLLEAAQKIRINKI